MGKNGQKTIIKGMSFLGFGGGNPVSVEVKDNKIIRIRPFHYDTEYSLEELRPWTMEGRNASWNISLQTIPNWLTMAYKRRVYSPNRIKYPLKRIDWDPNGKRNPQNRGKSKFVRISWDEATTLIADEIKRVVKEYGPYALMHQGDGHGESSVVHSIHGCAIPLLDSQGGYTKLVRNPDSWEGWWWGAKHIWGDGRMGMQWPLDNVQKDVGEHTEMLLFQGSDPETTSGTNSDLVCSPMLLWYREMGIKRVFICPDLNYSAAVHADKWIPILPNTDMALQCAIAYVWIKEDTYKKEYLDTHTVGFDSFKAYILGEDDGLPKTPEWASEICGITEWTIKALAREWAKKVTSIHHVAGGSYIRGPYSHEPARLEVTLLAMQGLGGPGVFQLSSYTGIPQSEIIPSVMEARRGETEQVPLPKQHLPKTLLTKAILDPPCSWYSTTSMEMPVEDQFVRYQYPVEGCSEIHFIWNDAPCWLSNWNGGNKFIEAMRSEKIECLVVQHPWLENDALFADLILPTNTKFETRDIGAGGRQFATIFIEEQAIDPIGESMSDYEAVVEVAKKLGVEEQLTEGKSIEEWMKFGYETSGVTDKISWEELIEKGYYSSPIQKDWQKNPVGWRGFYEDPENNPLPTPSGKLELYSERLAKHFPDDQERPPLPHYIAEGETHQEALVSKRAKDFPLLMISNHPRWRMHAQHDDIPWLREIDTCKIKGFDGYMYEPVWLHPQEAVIRNIKHGDIVKVFNERGAVLGGAYITERVAGGIAYMDHGARLDPITDNLDRGGAINTIVPTKILSKNCAGMATSGFLVEVERVSQTQIEEWKEKYPEAFERDYDPEVGLLFSGWVIE